MAWELELELAELELELAGLELAGLELAGLELAEHESHHGGLSERLGRLRLS